MQKTLFEQANAAADFIRARTSLVPRIAVVLGSGLGAFAAELQNAVSIPYSDIPHFPQSTVAGHRGRLVLGAVADIPIAALQGRVHAYEGYSSEQVAFPLRVLKLLGVEQIILTNAAGGINLDLHQGELVLLSDHINFTGRNPIAGENDTRFGPRFFDMSEAYSAPLRRIARDAAQTEGFPLREGVYLSVLGPSFETPAEIRAFRALGADLVGMSTVQETIAARQMSMEVLGISCVTNMAAGIEKEPLSHAEVLETGKRVETQLARLLKSILPKMSQEKMSQEKKASEKLGPENATGENL